MPSKTITLSKEAYDALKKCKRKDESFSEVIKRTFDKKMKLMDYAGVLSKESAERIRKLIMESRERGRDDS